MLLTGIIDQYVNPAECVDRVRDNPVAHLFRTDIGLAGYRSAAFRFDDSPNSMTKPIELIVRQDKSFRNIRLDYSDGVRYPRLEKTGEGEGSLDRLLQPKT